MPIPLRADFNAGLVRAAAKRSKDGPQARRLLTLAAIYDGATRTEAARIGGVTAADHPGLGDAVQCSWAGWSDRPQAARSTLEAQ
jgi:hypothetical protein